VLSAKRLSTLALQGQEWRESLDREIAVMARDRKNKKQCSWYCVKAFPRFPVRHRFSDLPITRDHGDPPITAIPPIFLPVPLTFRIAAAHGQQNYCHHFLRDR